MLLCEACGVDDDGGYETTTGHHDIDKCTRLEQYTNTS